MYDQYPSKEPETHAPQQKKAHGIREMFMFLVIALAIVVPIRIWIAQPFIVSGNSMVPTFENKDYLIIDQVTYYFQDPKRGDVVVFRFPHNPSQFFIKRIIGLPGERVSVSGNTVTIFNDNHPEGVRIDEPYTVEFDAAAGTYNLDADEYFVMGDNRPASSDSRSWGALDREFIKGRALLRLLPTKHIQALPGKYISEI